MRRLILKLFLFAFFLALIFAFPVWVLNTSGEWLPIERIAERHAGERPVLVGLAYSDYLGDLKLRAAQKRRAEILAVGSSRVMQFGSGLFSRSFYNAGVGQPHLKDFQIL